jgi:hypothetical protein
MSVPRAHPAFAFVVNAEIGLGELSSQAFVSAQHLYAAAFADTVNADASRVSMQPAPRNSRRLQSTLVVLTKVNCNDVAQSKKVVEWLHHESFGSSFSQELHQRGIVSDLKITIVKVQIVSQSGKIIPTPPKSTMAPSTEPSSASEADASIDLYAYVIATVLLILVCLLVLAFYKTEKNTNTTSRIDTRKVEESARDSDYNYDSDSDSDSDSDGYPDSDRLLVSQRLEAAAASSDAPLALAELQGRLKDAQSSYDLSCDWAASPSSVPVSRFFTHPDPGIGTGTGTDIGTGDGNGNGNDDTTGTGDARYPTLVLAATAIAEISAEEAAAPAMPPPRSPPSSPVRPDVKSYRLHFATRHVALPSPTASIRPDLQSYHLHFANRDAKAITPLQ